jgi:hypothetical protein
MAWHLFDIVYKLLTEVKWYILRCIIVYSIMETNFSLSTVNCPQSQVAFQNFQCYKLVLIENESKI